jgi:hypothetical protein
MPLFMDYHIVSDISIDAVKRGHMADRSVQDKHGVKYIQFWVNQEAGTIFCLIEAPDKESCEAVHQEAHGNIACNIVKVESGFYKLVMGESPKVDHGIALEIGFNSPSYFSKCFREKYGVKASNVAV